MILNSANLILTQKGAEKKEILKGDQAIVYQSPSKISTMGYAGKATRITESTTIPSTYFAELSKMKGFISLGTTGTGAKAMYKNIHLYSEQAEYLDGINRICYLFSDSTGTAIKICEYKKGTRGSRYSALFKILKNKLENNGFTAENETFSINLSNVTKFVNIVNEINNEQSQNKYVLVKSNDIDELNFGFFNIVYWQYSGIKCEPDKTKKPTDYSTAINNEFVLEIDNCHDIETLFELEKNISTLLMFCKAKIQALKLLEMKQSIYRFPHKVLTYIGTNQVLCHKY